jgi:hypothetical protein
MVPITTIPLSGASAAVPTAASNGNGTSITVPASAAAAVKRLAWSSFAAVVGVAFVIFWA